MRLFRKSSRENWLYTELVTDYGGKINHDVDVVEDLTISGQLNGNVVVREGARLQLSGQANGDVMVLDGAWLQLSGQLDGDLNCQGWADITGVLDGEIRVDGGTVLAAEGAHRRVNDQTLVLDSNGRWSPIDSGIWVITPDTPRWRWNGDGSMTRAEAPS